MGLEEAPFKALGPMHRQTILLLAIMLYYGFPRTGKLHCAHKSLWAIMFMCVKLPYPQPFIRSHHELTTLLKADPFFCPLILLQAAGSSDLTDCHTPWPVVGLNAALKYRKPSTL